MSRSEIASYSPGLAQRHRCECYGFLDRRQQFGIYFERNLVPTTIRAGQSVPFSVTFTPRVTGSASAAISFASNAHKSPAVLSLAGTGFPAPVASVTVESSSATIVPGKTHQFSATAKDARGNVITGVDFTWNSDAPQSLPWTQTVW